MTIYDIKRLTKETAPYFFSRDSMRFFRQKMKDFRVKKMEDGRYLVMAKSFGGNTTVRYFNPVNNELEFS